MEHSGQTVTPSLIKAPLQPPDRLSRCCEAEIAALGALIAICSDKDNLSRLRRRRYDAQRMLNFARTRNGYSLDDHTLVSLPYAPADASLSKWRDPALGPWSTRQRERH